MLRLDLQREADFRDACLNRRYREFVNHLDSLPSAVTPAKNYPELDAGLRELSAAIPAPEQPATKPLRQRLIAVCRHLLKRADKAA